MKRDRNNIDNLRLHADKEECFPLKSALKRSETLNYEGSEFDELCIAHAEGDNISNKENIIEGANDYIKLSLKADTTLTMPNSNSLKKQVNVTATRRLWLAIPVAVALIIAFFIIQKNNTDGTIEILADFNKNQIINKNTELIENNQNNNIQIIEAETKKSAQHDLPPQNKKIYTVKGNSSTINKNENNITILPYIEVIEPILPPTIMVSLSTIEDINTEMARLAQASVINNQLIEIDMPEDEPRSLFGKVGNLIADWNKPDNQIKVQDKIIGLNSLIGKSSTVINEYTEDGELQSTQINSEGLKYNKHYKTDTNVEVYVVEVSPN